MEWLWISGLMVAMYLMGSYITWYIIKMDKPDDTEQKVFGFHPEWTVSDMCETNCLACRRLDELINERYAGYKEGVRDARETAGQVPSIPDAFGEPMVNQVSVLIAIDALDKP